MIAVQELLNDREDIFCLNPDTAFLHVVLFLIGFKISIELPLRRFVLFQNRNARRMANVKQNAMLGKTVKMAEGSRESGVGIHLDNWLSACNT
jgi:hypothetical protein